MKFLKYSQFLSLLGSFAFAFPSEHNWHDHKFCLSDADAEQLVSVIVSLSVSFDPAYVSPFFTNDFTLQSDSLNWVVGLPAGAVSYSDKNLLIASAYNFTTTNPELNPPVTVSFLYYIEDIIACGKQASTLLHGCTDIAYRSETSEAFPVQGIHIIRTRRENEMWKIYLSFDEFNSAADLASLGVPCTLTPL